MKNKYFITGATGFVGSCITKALVQNGEDVSILVRDKKLNWRLSDISHKLEIYVGDLQSTNLQPIVDNIKPDIIFHLAASGALPTQKADVMQLFDTNIKGSIRLLDAVKKHKFKLFVNTGSSSEYGIKDSSMKEIDRLEPINDYGITKSAATLYCQKIAKTENLPIITLRLFSPYGYYDDNKRLISYVISSALKNKPIVLSSKLNVRDFIYIEDVVEAYLQAVRKKNHFGEIINIGSGQQYSVYDIVKQIIAIIGSNSQLEWGKMPKQTRQIEPKIWQADITKAKKLLQWEPKYSLEKGLRKTISQFKKYNHE